MSVDANAGGAQNVPAREGVIWHMEQAAEACGMACVWNRDRRASRNVQVEMIEDRISMDHRGCPLVIFEQNGLSVDAL